MAGQVKKEEVKKTALEALGFKKAGDAIQAFKNRRCLFIEPVGLALMCDRIDPINGLPGIPMGSQVEIFGPPGKGKSAIADHFIKNIHQLDPKAKVALLCFEEYNPERMEGLFKQGVDKDRLYILDYTNEALKDADTGLNMLLELAQSGEVVALIIDSVGASAVSKEVYDKNGDLVGVDTNLAMCARANTYTKFANQFQTINPLIRPVLIYINHYKDKVGQDDASTAQLKANQIGEDLNLPTPGGWGFKYNLNMRLKIDARKWPPPKSTDPKHELYNYREQKGLEVFIKAPRNRFFPGFKECHAILDFSNPNEVRFDIESEVISLCSLLDVEGIQETGNGRVKFPKMGTVSYWKKDVVAWLKDNPEYRWELIRKLAPLAQKAFKFGKEAPPDKDSANAPV